MKLRPYGCVIAGVLSSSYVTIDACALQTLRQNGTQQNVVETETAIPFPTVPHVIPKRVHRLFEMERANGAGPTLRKKALIRGAALGAAGARHDLRTSFRGIRRSTIAAWGGVGSAARLIAQLEYEL